MEKYEKKETTYVCRFKEKSVTQSITVNKDVPYGFYLTLNGCATTLDDVILFHKFLGEIIEEHKKQVR